MREIVLGRRLPEGQLSLDRAARAVTLLGINACSPLGDQRHPRQHLGQLLVRVVQDAAVGRHDQDSPSGHRRGDRLPAAGRRPRLHPAGVARQPLVDGAVPAEQHRRTVRVEPVGRGADAVVPGVDRADAVAGAAREGSAVRRRERARRRRDRSHHRRQLSRGAGGVHLRRRCARWSASSRRLFPFLGGEGGVGQGRAVPEGMPVGLITNIDLLGDDLPEAERDEHRRKLLALVEARDHAS